MTRRSPLIVLALCGLLAGCDKPSAKTAAPAADVEQSGESAASGESSLDADDESDPLSEARTAGNRLLLAATTKDPRRPYFQTAYEFEELLLPGDAAANQTAAELLAVTHQVVLDEPVAEYVDAVAKEDPVAAAKLLLEVVRAQLAAVSYETGLYAVGRLVIADGKYKPADVMAQMPITAEGYFASEIGTRDKPLAFRAPGYENLDVPLAEIEADAMLLGDVEMAPLAPEHRATLRGKVVVDDASQGASAKVELGMSVGPVNTPHNGYSPRRSWPDRMTYPIAEDGVIEAEGLNPSEYYVSITADDHAKFSQRMTLEPGNGNDIGEVRLRSMDLGFYLDREAPETPELAWEKDFDAALERAKSENRPLMVMMTATWCGPCKMLEAESLSNVWIRHFLEPFVVVQAFEEKDVEDKYGCGGYPTLVFCDSAGESAFKTVGYAPPIEFAAECAKAINAVKLDLPAELRELIDKKVIEIE